MSPDDAPGKPQPLEEHHVASRTPNDQDDWGVQLTGLTVLASGPANRSRSVEPRMSESSDDAVRIDKWLWAARLFKTRSTAARAIVAGKVQVNGRRVKRASTLHLGDRVRVRKGVYEYQLVVRRLSERRGPAAEAVTLYEETSESVRAREQLAQGRKASPRFSFRDKGRPTKKERRQLERLRQQDRD